MKLFLIVRNDEVDYDEYDSAVVIAETPERALEMLKREHGTSSYYCPWGKYNVTITEVIPEAEKILIESFYVG